MAERPSEESLDDLEQLAFNGEGVDHVRVEKVAPADRWGRGIFRRGSKAEQP